jgi:fructose-1,6-bisphosphatase
MEQILVIDPTSTSSHVWLPGEVVPVNLNTENDTLKIENANLLVMSAALGEKANLNSEVRLVCSYDWITLLGARFGPSTCKILSKFNLSFYGCFLVTFFATAWLAT